MVGLWLKPGKRGGRGEREVSRSSAAHPHPPDLGGGVRDAEHAHSHRLGHDEERRVVPERLSRHGRLGAAAVHKRQMLSRRRRITIRCAAHGGGAITCFPWRLARLGAIVAVRELHGAPLRAPTRDRHAAGASGSARFAEFLLSRGSLPVDILWPRWVARIGVTRSTHACFLAADRQCTELPLLRLPRLVPELVSRE